MISASVFFAAGKFTLQVTDQTSGETFVTVEACGSQCDRTNAEWIVERPGAGRFSLADFSTVKIIEAAAGANDSSGGVSAYNHRKISIVLNGNTLSAPGELISQSNGTAFTVNWTAGGSGPPAQEGAK